MQMMTTRYTLGMGQLLVEGGKLDANLARAARMIRQAADEGCSIVVLPECLDVGWTHPSARELAAPIPGMQSDALCQAARQARIHVVAGITERAGDRLYNTALLISPDGEVLLTHRKINILSIAQDLYAIGDRLSVVETSLGIVGLTICADNFPNSLVFAHSLARMGARILLSPSAWAVDADHDNAKEPYGGMWREAYSTIATLYGVTVVGVSNVGWITGGPWKGRKCIGCSLAVGPDGAVLAQGPYGEAAEALVIVPITLTPAEAKGTSIAGVLARKGYEGP